MSSGLNCRRSRPFNIWRTGGINQLQCIQIIQPQIKLHFSSSDNRPGASLDAGISAQFKFER
nr:MAG TPA: hypothetical protein [Caudoviricetes sp.]